jgi:hypothetical protein
MAASQSIRTWASTQAVEGRITSGRVEERDRNGKGQRDAHRLQGLGSPRQMPNDQVGGTCGNTPKLTIRPHGIKLLDAKTGEAVDFLFLFRLTVVGKSYLNRILIPVLCSKAGVPTADVRGNITSHRARSTIASQLFNAKEPVTLFELQEWLGHETPTATQHYAKITPTKLAKSYSDAGYFTRNLRAIEVLVDQELVRKGRAANEPWKFYDLGHGYCTYDFFDQCPHRMACAKCSFYLPKDSTKAQLLEAKANLLRLRQDIPLAETELAAVEDGLIAYEQLLAKLADVPTPAGPTPRQLADGNLVQLRVPQQPTRSDHR